jgi:hypothetical protein
MITISIQIDETDLDLFAKVFTAAHLKLRTNGVNMTAEAHKRVLWSRIVKTGLDEEQRRFIADRVDTAKKVQTLFRNAPERMA